MIVAEGNRCNALGYRWSREEISYEREDVICGSLEEFGSQVCIRLPICE